MPPVASRRRLGGAGTQKTWRRLTAGLTRAPLPEAPAAMLCTLVDEPFDDPSWLFEPKYDGLRVLARFDGREVTLLSRNGQSQNFQFPEIVGALRERLDVPVVLDGEVVCFDAHGRTSFRSLQQRFHLQDAGEVERRMQRFPAYVYLFDVLYADGYDLRNLPLRDRKRVLRQVVQWTDRIRWTEVIGVKKASASFGKHAARGDEGIIGKHLDSRYLAGRSDRWVKIKCLGRQELVIGGFTDPQHSRVGLGALLVGYYTPDGRQLLYAGKVGTGYTYDVLLDLRRRLDRLEQSASPFAGRQPARSAHVHWVKPRLVAEIAFSEWTQNDLLRQPRYEGLRPDKSPRECKREEPAAGRRARKP